MKYKMKNDKSEKPKTGVFICKKGNLKAPCSVPHCAKRHVALCDWPVKRDGVKGTCDAKLCQQHATRIKKNKDYCPPHVKLREKRRSGE